MLLIYLMYFVVVTLLFQLLVKHSSAVLPCERFVNKHLYIALLNNLFVHYTHPHRYPHNYKLDFTVN